MSPRLDLVERRYLGALLFVDQVSKTPIQERLRLAPPLAGSEVQFPIFLRNRRNRYAVAWAPGLEEHLLSAIPREVDLGIRAPRPPAWPFADRARIDVRVEDPAGRYLPLRFTLVLPRDPSPANAKLASSLFRPKVVRLMPAPSAPIDPGWAAVRVRVHDQADRGLPFALLRLTRESTAEEIGLGLTDCRGEGLVAVAELEAQEWGSTPSEPISLREIACRLEAFYDPELNPFRPEISELEASPDPHARLHAPDVADLLARRAELPKASTLPGALPLSSGRIDRQTLAIELPT